jgi:hypothetical protein
MTLNNSSEFIYCQTCANAWELTDTREMYYFQSASLALGSYTSPALIVAAAEEMIFCPECDVDQLADAYRKPHRGIQESPFYDKDSRMIGADVDKGGSIDGDADVVHRTNP